MVIVDAQGTNPFAAEGRRNGMLTITVQQGSEIRQSLCPITAGDIRCDDVAIPFYASPTRIRIEAEFDGGSEPWLGATPFFVPLFYPTVRVIIGPAGQCARVAETTLGEVRIGGTLLTAEEGVTLYAVGGVSESGGGTTGMDIIELPLLSWPGSPTLEPSRVFAVEGGFAETRAILFDVDGNPPLLVLSGSDASIVQLSSGMTDRIPVALHAGAGLESALYSRGPNEVVVVGGRTAAGRVSDVSIVNLTTEDTVAILEGALAVPRANPAVAVLADGSVLVAGGQEEGQPLFELLSPTTTSSVGAFGDTGARSGPVLALDPGRRAALMVGGADETGAVVPETIIISTCASVCGTSLGPVWPTPRLGPAVQRRRGETPAQGSTVLLGGTAQSGGTLAPSDAVEAIVWDASVPRFQALGPLSQRRERHSVAALGSDVLIVGGGQGVDAPTRDLDICWPEAFPAL